MLGSTIIQKEKAVIITTCCALASRHDTNDIHDDFQLHNLLWRTPIKSYTCATEANDHTVSINTDERYCGILWEGDIIHNFNTLKKLGFPYYRFVTSNIRGIFSMPAHAFRTRLLLLRSHIVKNMSIPQAGRLKAARWNVNWCVHTTKKITLHRSSYDILHYPQPLITRIAATRPHHYNNLRHCAAH